MAKKILIALLMLAGAALTSTSALAAEPSLHEVYQAAEAGKLTEAQSMMREVLSAHPGSGKAHFVEAELLVKQGQLQKAEAELANAERLAPGLPFAKPQAVQNLRAQLGSSRPARSLGASPIEAPQPAARPSPVPWGMLLVGLGLIAFIVFAARLMARRNAPPTSAPGNYAGFSNPASGGAPLSPYAAAAGGTGAGMGSRIMGGLATGAALGVGMMAGEALMHRFVDGKDAAGNSALGNALAPTLPDASLDDLGGADFGVADAGSWDDSSGGGDSDWN